MSSLGNLLRTKREKLNLKIQDISKITAIRTQWLELLEAGKFDEMPSYVHVHGFASQYAKALGLDFDTEVKPLLDEECPKSSFGQNEEIGSEQEASLPKSYKNILISAFVVVVLLAVAAYVKTRPVKEDVVQSRPEPVPITELPVTYDPAVLIGQLNGNGNSTKMAQDNATASALPSNPEPTEPAVTRTGFNALLTYADECWTYVASDRGETADFTAGAGDRRVIPFDRYFRVDVGNAAAITVTVNGKDLTDFGRQNQVVRNIYISVDNGSVQVARTQPQ